MLLCETDELLLDVFDPPPPYEEEEYDVYLLWPSHSPPLLIPAPCNAELDPYAVHRSPVAAPECGVAGLRPPHFLTNNNSGGAPPTASRLSTRPPYFHLSFPTPHRRQAVELDALALPPRNLESSFFEEPAFIEDDTSQQLADIGYSNLFCSGLALKSRQLTKQLDTLYRKIQHAFKTLTVTRTQRGV
ncbi:uncharacterized protein PHACADRAFT_250417 [Phanerochaete carnosa HHB-10118-sp]|uniref:Uncharacterized protein n=1 Tax=Phanerochaete carnosa (strain HHB-10118-sp) TaxID=650164 RepID=K5VA35_PHACS|nr:uncharacterized protein PHACADRAFT_250417 [Phanerochaete carnosa HHB-10118-sp]EKM59731.1 hypothetical protein PHACADRAFT_250417 [Phanerochaete carnosa HHB-10118-sp]